VIQCPVAIVLTGSKGLKKPRIEHRSNTDDENAVRHLIRVSSVFHPWLNPGVRRRPRKPANDSILLLQLGLSLHSAAPRG